MSSSLATLLQLQILYDIYRERNIIAGNEWGGVRVVVVQGRRRKITVLIFAYGTEENYNTLSKAREKQLRFRPHTS